MALLCPLSLQQITNARGIVVGASVSFFDSGTLTPRAVFKDQGLTTPWLQPILTDSAGRIPIVYTGGNPLRVRIVEPSGVSNADIPYVPGDVASGGGGGGGGGGDSVLETGDIVPSYRTGIRAGMVRANGRTIGNPTSGATEYAAADALNLYVFLWNADSTLVVVGGRGASGLEDFNAGKQLTLPDFRGVVLGGLDDMGSSPAGLYAGITFTRGNATTLGSMAGSATTTLDGTMIPNHVHTGTTATAGNHQHSFTTASAGAHTHPGSAIATAGAHNHGGATEAAGGHTHGAQADNQGQHSHSGSTDTQGDHAHSYNGALITNATAGAGAAPGYLNTSTGEATSTNGAHSHALEIDGAGLHSHNITVLAIGDHAHIIDTDGTHTHTLTIASDGAHVHTGTTDAGGAHQHSFTTDATGGGLAHPNLQPTVLISWYLVL